MHAEVSIRFTEEIRAEWLTAGLPAATDPKVVLAQTFFSNSPDVLSSVIYARLETTFVYLVFWDDRRSVRIHVEGRASKGDLRQLVRQSEELSDRFVDAGRTHGCSTASVRISLFADDYLITSGTRRSFGSRLLKRFAETIFGDVMVGLFTGLITVVTTKQWHAAIIATVASILCFLAWLVIQISGGRDAYEYEGV